MVEAVRQYVDQTDTLGQVSAELHTWQTFKWNASVERYFLEMFVF